VAQTTGTVVHHLPITKARINLGQVVRRVVRNKEYFILEKDGIPVAGILGADELEDYLEARNSKVRAHIRKSAAEQHAGKARPMGDFLAELDGAAPRTKAKRRKRT
jgi:antitoxin (DNA-binding transcriptional repressor) of toxin-antitoxin stability system